MIDITRPKRPETFEENQEYLLRVRQIATQESAYLSVFFIEYAPCPAFIYVQKEGVRERVPRDDVFTLKPLSLTKARG